MTVGASAMVSVDAAVARARRLVERDKREWAARTGADPVFEAVLHPPSERAVLTDHAAAIAWVQSWRAVLIGAAHVIWTRKRWPSVGEQEVPERVVVAGADAIAEFAGAAASRGWRTLRDRADRVRMRFGGGGDALAQVIRRNSSALERLTESDFLILLDVVEWLVGHPSSGSRVRQLPIRGIDTKWLEAHRALAEGLHTAVTGCESLGLLAPPALVRLRFLDPTLLPGGPTDITAPVEQLAELDLSPATVFVFENLETVLSMPEMPGAVVVHGSGYAANRLSRMPWIKRGRVLYWGDLDSDGFAILHALRSGCDDVTSVLMDSATLLAFRDLWVPEKKPARGTYPTLTSAESIALERVRSEGDVRLEQERIPWETALAALTEAARPRGSHSVAPNELTPE